MISKICHFIAQPYNIKTLSDKFFYPDCFFLLDIFPMVWQVDAWAQSNTVPGLFTGSTGAQVLSSEELSTSGPQAWLKKVNAY